MRSLSILNVPKRLLIDKPYSLRLYPFVRRAFPYTQLSYAGLSQMYELIYTTEKRNIQGAIVEMGCGRGGNGAFMAKMLERMGARRCVWLFDSFEGLSDPRPEDFRAAEKNSEKIRRGYLAVDQKNVAEALKALRVTDKERVRVVKGWFNETVPVYKKKIGEIAILRLDADLYEPTWFCLEELYDQVVPGGYMVIDDYKNWVGARRALYEFFYERNIAPFIQIYPHGGVAYFEKG